MGGRSESRILASGTILQTLSGDVEFCQIFGEDADAQRKKILAELGKTDYTGPQLEVVQLLAAGIALGSQKSLAKICQLTEANLQAHDAAMVEDPLQQ